MKRATCSLLLCLLAGSAWAQNSAVSLRTLQLGGDEVPDSWIRAPKEKELVKLKWLTSQPTVPVQAVHNGELKLFHYTEDEDGNLVAEVAKSVRLPASAREVLLMAWSSDGDTRYVAIKDEFINAKFNDWLAINTSANPVAMIVGDKGKPIRVNPGKSLIFRPRIQEGKGARVLAQAPRKGETKTFLSSYWPVFPGQRTLIIFYDDGDKMRARRIGDRFLPKKEDGEE